VAKWLFLVFKGHYLSRELQKPCGYKKGYTFKLSVAPFENRQKKQQLHRNKKASYLFELA
jgi:hypothetical protein